MNPDKVQARKMVLVGVLALGIIGVYRDRRAQDPTGTFRVMWATGVVGLMLTFLADFAPKIAGPFAVLIVLGSLTNGGDRALQSALGVIAPTSSGSGSGAPARSGSTPTPTTPTPTGG